VQVFRRIICIDIVNIGSLPYCGLMDHFVITGKVWIAPENLERMPWLTSSTVSWCAVRIVLSVKKFGGFG
jgi:hypothetical protein